MNYKKLASKALQKATIVRSKAGIDLVSPVCAFDVSEKVGVSVKFTDINMDGSYIREPKPRIVLSSLRPLQRRNFTCGHELGHHAFGHGFSVDQILGDGVLLEGNSPEEFLAESFAGFLHLPSLGVRKAFSSRGWNPKNATPLQILIIASNFGVGYSTLINQLSYSLEFISEKQAISLLRYTPQKIRSEFLGVDSSTPLVVVDEKWLGKTIDIEVGTELSIPNNVLPSTELLAPVNESRFGNHFLAKSSGITRIISADNRWSVFVRIAPFQFIGLGKFRHLEKSEDED